MVARSQDTPRPDDKPSLEEAEFRKAAGRQKQAGKALDRLGDDTSEISFEGMTKEEKVRVELQQELMSLAESSKSEVLAQDEKLKAEIAEFLTKHQNARPTDVKALKGITKKAKKLRERFVSLQEKITNAPTSDELKTVEVEPLVVATTEEAVEATANDYDRWLKEQAEKIAATEKAAKEALEIPKVVEPAVPILSQAEIDALWESFDEDAAAPADETKKAIESRGTNGVITDADIEALKTAYGEDDKGESSLGKTAVEDNVRPLVDQELQGELAKTITAEKPVLSPEQVLSLLDALEKGELPLKERKEPSGEVIVLDSLNKPKEHRAAADNLLARVGELDNLPAEAAHFLARADYEFGQDLIKKFKGPKGEAILTTLSVPELQEVAEALKVLLQRAYKNRRESQERVVKGEVQPNDLVKVLVDGKYEDGWMVSEVDEEAGVVTVNLINDVFSSQDVALKDLAAWQKAGAELSAAEKVETEIKEEIAALSKEVEDLFYILNKKHSEVFDSRDSFGGAIQDYQTELVKITSPDFDFDDPANAKLYLDFVNRRAPGMIRATKEVLDGLGVDYSPEAVAAEREFDLLLDKANEISSLNRQKIVSIESRWPDFIFTSDKDLNEALAARLTTSEKYAADKTMANIKDCLVAEEEFSKVLDLVAKNLANNDEMERGVRDRINEAKIRGQLEGKDFEFVAKELVRAEFAHGDRFLVEERVKNMLAALVKEQALGAAESLDKEEIMANLAELTGLSSAILEQSLANRQGELEQVARQLGQPGGKRSFWSKLYGASKVIAKIGVYAGVGTVATLATGGIGGALVLGAVRIVDAKISGSRSEKEMAKNLQKVKNQITGDSPEGKAWLEMLTKNMAADLAVNKQRQIDGQKIGPEKTDEQNSLKYIEERLELTELNPAEKEMIVAQARAMLRVDAQTTAAEEKLAVKNKSFFAKSGAWLDRKMPDTLKSLWSGGKTAGEKVKTAGIFAVAGTLARACPGVRRVMMAYSGAKAFEAIGMVITSGLDHFEELNLVTAEQIPLKASDEMINRARGQLLDKKFQAARPADYGRLKERVDKVMEQKIKQAEKAMEAIGGLLEKGETALLRRSALENQRKLVTLGAQVTGAAVGAMFGAEAIKWLGATFSEEALKPMMNSEEGKAILAAIQGNEILTQVRGTSNVVGGFVREQAAALGNATGAEGLSQWGGHGVDEIIKDNQLPEGMKGLVEKVAVDGRLSNQEVVTLTELNTHLQNTGLPPAVAGGFTSAEQINNLNTRLGGLEKAVGSLSGDGRQAVINEMVNKGLNPEKITQLGSLVEKVHGKVEADAEAYLLKNVIDQDFNPEQTAQAEALVTSVQKIDNPDAKKAIFAALVKDGVTAEKVASLNAAIGAVDGSGLTGEVKDQVLYQSMKDGAFGESEQKMVKLMGDIAKIPGVEANELQFVAAANHGDVAKTLENISRAVGGDLSDQQSLSQIEQILSKGDANEINAMVSAARVDVVHRGDTLTELLHRNLDMKVADQDPALARAFVHNYLGEDALADDQDVNQEMINKAIGVAAVKGENLGFVGNKLIFSSDGSVEMVKGLGAADAKRVAEWELRRNYLVEQMHMDRSDFTNIKVTAGRSFVFESGGQTFTLDGAGTGNVTVHGGEGAVMNFDGQGKLVDSEGLILPEGDKNVNFHDVIKDFDNYTQPEALDLDDPKQLVEILGKEGIIVSDGQMVERLNPKLYKIDFPENDDFNLVRIYGGDNIPRVLLLAGDEVIYYQDIASGKLSGKEATGIKTIAEKTVEVRDQIAKEYELEPARAMKLVSDVRGALGDYSLQPNYENVHQLISDSGDAVDLLSSREQCSVAVSLINNGLEKEGVMRGLDFTDDLHGVSEYNMTRMASIYVDPKPDNPDVKYFLNTSGLKFGEEPQIIAKDGKIQIIGLHSKDGAGAFTDSLQIDSKTSSIEIDRTGENYHLPASRWELAGKAIAADTDGKWGTGAADTIREGFAGDKSLAPEFSKQWLGDEAAEWPKAPEDQLRLLLVGYNDLDEMTKDGHEVISSIKLDKKDNALIFKMTTDGLDTEYAVYPDRNLVLRTSGAVIRDTEVLTKEAFNSQFTIDRLTAEKVLAGDAAAAAKKSEAPGI